MLPDFSSTELKSLLSRPALRRDGWLTHPEIPNSLQSNSQTIDWAPQRAASLPRLCWSTDIHRGCSAWRWNSLSLASCPPCIVLIPPTKTPLAPELPNSQGHCPALQPSVSAFLFERASSSRRLQLPNSAPSQSQLRVRLGHSDTYLHLTSHETLIEHSASLTWPTNSSFYLSRGPTSCAQFD